MTQESDISPIQSAVTISEMCTGRKSSKQSPKNVSHFNVDAETFTGYASNVQIRFPRGTAFLLMLIMNLILQPPDSDCAIGFCQ